MNVFYITCAATGNIWSRNGWANPTAIPDLYTTKARANTQVTKGKCSILRRYIQRPDGTFKTTSYHPVIKKATLSL